MTDVTIIGSGIAAIAAASEVVRQGVSITMIRGRPGATALSSGAWDIAGAPTRHPALKWHEVPSPTESLRELIRRYPRHPYSLLSQNDSCRDLSSFLSGAIGQLSSALKLKLRGGLEKTLSVLNPLGGIKRTAFIQQSQWGGNLTEMKQARLLVVGFRGLPQFAASSIAILLREIHQRQETPYLANIQASEISLKKLPSVLSPIDLASRLDNDEMIESLHQTLLQESEKSGATHIALAPVIGIQKTDHILNRLRETTGLAWFETVGLPPSLPGLRLQHAIDQFLQPKDHSAGKILEGEAIGVSTKHRRIEHLRVRIREKEEELPVDRLILATGRYLGGGIVKEKGVREPVLNLPLFLDGMSVEEVFTGKVVEEKFLGDHPLFSVGVRTNQNLQPVGERGNVLYENLWAAGSLIGGYNPAVQQCGMGVAVGTGTLAGRIASL